LVKVHVLQVDKNPANIAELSDGVGRGHTVTDWQMPKDSKPGDLVIWYAAGRQQYIAQDGWMPPRRRLEKAPGPIAARLLVWSGSNRRWTARR
jgi:hypothetical protein